MTAAEVVQAYLWPWQIELFLRWLKGHFHLPRLLDSSGNAVLLFVWLAILVHLLTLLAARDFGRGRRSPLLLARLAVALQHLAPTGSPGLAAPGAQLPLPGFDWLVPILRSHLVLTSQNIQDGIDRSACRYFMYLRA